MADSFFGFDAALPSHEDDGAGFEVEEEEYDALNDETFGADGFDNVSQDDWEQSHEKLAEITESARVHRNSFNESSSSQQAAEDEEDGLVSGSAAAQLEASLSRMVLEDFDPLSPVKSRPPPSFPASLPAAPWPPTNTPPLPPPQHQQSNGNVQMSALSIINHMAALQQHQPRDHQQRVPSVRTVEDLERDLRARSTMTPRPEKKAETRLANLRGSEQSFGPVVSPSRGDGKQPPHKPPSSNLAELLSAAAAGLFPRPPPPPPHLGGRPPPRFMPPNGKPPFPHPPPPNGPGMMPGMYRPFPPPHRMPPPPLMSHPPPNFHPQRMPPNRGELPFPWMHQPPPRHPLNPLHPNFMQLHQQQQEQHLHLLQQHRMNGVHDPYAGLMSPKDKQWLINIQILQLNSQKPYVDDFYYTAFQLKQQLARERAGERGVSVPRREQRTLEPRAYTPAQFEGSLGKLQVVSVTAPRKIIDMELVSSDSGDQDKPTRDSRRTKQTLLELERLYLLVLQLEDLVHPMPEARLSVSDPKEEIVSRALAAFTSPSGEDKLPAFLCVRKGKTLLQRLLPHLSHSQQIPLWRSLLRGFWGISRRDSQDQLLADLYPAFSLWGAQATLPALLEVSSALVLQASDDRTASPATRSPLPVALANKFGVSVITTMLNRAGELSDCSTPPATHPEWQDWSRFVSSLTRAAEDTRMEVCSPIEPLRASVVKDLSLQKALENDRSISAQN